MRQEHAQRDLEATGVTRGEFRDDRGDRGVEVEQSAFVQDHGHGGSGNDFCDRCQVKDALEGDGGSGEIVGEAAKGLVGDEFSAESDGERARGEGAGGDGVFK